MSGDRLHIVSFDIPYPPDYGGVIDVFWKIRALHDQGVRIILHAFTYGSRKPAGELERYCEKIFYYPRKTGYYRLISTRPYIIVSRCNRKLITNILKDKAPVLLEGWHSSCHLQTLKDAGIKVIVREHNLEWKYYEGLASNTFSFLKKIYFRWEAAKLKRYEKQLYIADQVMCISPLDVHYHTENGYQGAVYLPVFHPVFAYDSLTGMGKYALYQGNLGVEENSAAVSWLIKEVWKEIDYPLVIAGKNCPRWLRTLIQSTQNVSLQEDPADMDKLILEAHMHVLPAMQDTGIKLKLLHALYEGRHCIVNTIMLAGTGLNGVCHIANTPAEWQTAIRELISVPYAIEEKENRVALLKSLYDNAENAGRLITWIDLLPS